jgi:hypothetical protein
MTKVAILQSNYIPWKGVFDMINQVDKFIFFEDVDYTKRDWRTRNNIKTANGDVWLTVPVKKMPRGTKIFEMDINNDGKWQHKHLSTIKLAYGKAKYFKEFEWILDEIYVKHTWVKLSDFNIFVTKLLAKVLCVDAEFVNSVDLATDGTKDEKLINICQKVNATHYLSGPAAKDYIDNDKFKLANIELSYMDYSYVEYPQLHGDFNHYVSVLDLIFNCGDEARSFIIKK